MDISPDTFGFVCFAISVTLGITACALDECKQHCSYELLTRHDYKTRPKKSDLCFRTFFATAAIAVLFGGLFVRELANDNTTHPSAEARIAMERGQ